MPRDSYTKEGSEMKYTIDKETQIPRIGRHAFGPDEFDVNASLTVENVDITRIERAISNLEPGQQIIIRRWE
jgi:hypothetical protein